MRSCPFFKLSSIITISTSYQRIAEPPPFSGIAFEELNMDPAFTSALDAVLEGNAIAFLGAGFSLGAKNLAGADLLSGTALAEKLAAEISLPLNTPLDQISEVYLATKSQKELLELLKHQFLCGAPSKAQDIITSVPWRRTYTTNYDDVFETSSHAQGITVTPLTLSSAPSAIPLNAPCCIHINGFLRNATEEMLQTELKLTSTSYLTQAFSNSQWSQYFRFDIDLASHIFFIGYSLYDLDIKRILFGCEHLAKKCYFITSTRANEVQRILLAQFGEVAPIGTDAFAQMLEARRKAYVPSSKHEPTFSSFPAFVLPATPTSALSDAEAIDLFTFGRISVEAIVASQSGNPASFHVHRRAVANILNEFATGTKSLLVHSELGNGKTLIIEDVKVAMARGGWSVYSLDNRGPGAVAELEWICKNVKKPLIVVENYPDHIDLLSTLNLIRAPDLALLISSRSSVHDIYCQRLDDVFSEIRELDVNKLYPEDAAAFSKLLDKLGMWGDLAGEAAELKTSIIKNDCRSELHAVLLRAFECQVIKDRLNEIVDAVGKDPMLRDIAIVAMVLEYIGKPRPMDFVMQVLDTESPNQSQFRKNPALRQLVSFRSGQLQARNPVLAESLLHSVFLPAHVMSVLKRIIRVCHDHYSDDYGGWNPFKNVYNDVIQFGKLQGLLPEKNRLPLIREFYEYVKVFPYAAKHPHFWLQYAVAMLSLREYAAAKQYFKAAYSFAEKRTNYDTSFIDNSYARFLLETTIAKGTAPQAMQYFDDAAEIIVKQARLKVNRFYPYRVASKIRDFSDRFGSELSDAERQRISKAAREVLETIPKLEPRIRNHRDVLFCEKQLLKLC